MPHAVVDQSRARDRTRASWSVREKEKREAIHVCCVRRFAFAGSERSKAEGEAIRWDEWIHRRFDGRQSHHFTDRFKWRERE